MTYIKISQLIVRWVKFDESPAPEKSKRYVPRFGGKHVERIVIALCHENGETAENYPMEGGV